MTEREKNLSKQLELTNELLRIERGYSDELTKTVDYLCDQIVKVTTTLSCTDVVKARELTKMMYKIKMSRRTNNEQ